MTTQHTTEAFPPASTAEPVHGPLRAEPRPRLESVDRLRGLVMVLMALDHVRDYVWAPRFDPADLSQTTAAWFLIRWVTHFCAPVFIFLAGTSAFLLESRGMERGRLTRWLLSRGLWLVFAELTFIVFAWDFNLRNQSVFGLRPAVIWALGVSMMVLALLVHLPRWAVGAFGLVMVLGHNLLDGVSAEQFGTWAPLWTILHQQAPTQIGSVKMFIVYPLVPWFGVMALGYAFGPLLLRPAEQRQRWLVRLGLGMTIAFVALRALSVYGEPRPWSEQPTALFTVLSFLNTTKYPPSLLYLLMTLGPAMLALAGLERARGKLAEILAVYGRVPFFYYLLHLYLIHTVAIVLGVLQGYPASAFFDVFLLFPQGYGLGVGGVLAVWVGVVLALYWPCRWFGHVKRTHRSAWLSYL